MATLTDTAVIASERYAAQALIAASRANVAIDEDNLWVISPPVGFGDCLLLELQFELSSFGNTPVALTAGLRYGSSAFILDAGTLNPRDIVDVREFSAVLWEVATAEAKLACHMNPDRPVLWKQGEVLALYVPVMTNDASDTADLYVASAVRRLRNQGL